jgi:uncharacterized protein (UPF0335 family)
MTDYEKKLKRFIEVLDKISVKYRLEWDQKEIFDEIDDLGWEQSEVNTCLGVNSKALKA